MYKYIHLFFYLLQQLESLPQNFRVEIAIHVHLAALKRVPIFAEAQPGLLTELVTRLKLKIFSPGDYVCKKGNY